MALIYALHPEILSIIFENTKEIADEIPLISESAAGKKHNGVAFEVIACGVCTYFREVALATPALWTSTRVHGASDPENIAQRLGHAGDCWLDIRIDLGAKDPQMDEGKLKPIIDNILQHSLRWRSLCIAYSYYELRDRPIVKQLCSAPAPGLRHLSLIVDDVDRADVALINRAANLPHIFKDGTPKLEFLRLRGFAIHFFRPPLGSVVTLHLEQTRSLYIQYSTLKDILTASPHLAHLSMSGDVLPRGNWPDVQKAIELPTLCSLRMFSIAGDAFAGILKIINAPKLESLTLKGLLEEDLDPVWNITDKNRFETLRSLSFVECDISASACKRMFSTFRQITTFSAPYASVEGKEQKVLDVLSEGTVRSQDGNEYVPWPKLTTLRLGSDFYVNGQEARNKLVTVRKEHRCPISALVFKMNSNEMRIPSPTTVEAAAGVQIKFCGRVIWPENDTYFDCDDTAFQNRAAV